MDNSDEEVSRADASQLLSSLAYDEEQQLSKRRFLSRDWPEPLKNLPSDMKEVFCCYHRCVSESLVRNEEDNDLLHDIVERSSSKLFDDACNPSTSTSVDPEKLSDLEVVKNLPSVVKSLRISVLQSIFCVLSGSSRKSTNRKWLEKAVIDRIRKVFREAKDDLPDTLKQVLIILKEPSTFKSSARSTLPNFPLPDFPLEQVEAARMALGKLTDMSIRGLHAMQDFLKERPFEEEQLYIVKPGRSRKDLANVIMSKAEMLLNEAGTVLPRCLQKALRVMSLVGMEVHGRDGNLGRILRAQSPETEELQRRLLTTISQLSKLTYQDLEDIYKMIAWNPEVNRSSFYRETIANVLREALYRCNHRNVPSAVVEAMNLIAAVKPKVCSFEQEGVTNNKEINPNSLKLQRLEAEREALLNLSSHLQQMIWEWRRKPPLPVISSQSEAQQAKNEKAYEEERTNWHVKKEVQGEADDRKGKDEEDDDEDEEEEEEEEGESLEYRDAVDRETLEIGDQGAALAYVILGRAMEEKCRRIGNLKDSSRRYLQSGFDDDPGEQSGDGMNESDSKLLMRIVGEIPGVSQSALNNMRIRLNLNAIV